MATSHDLQASTTDSDGADHNKAKEISCCTCYFLFLMLFIFAFLFAMGPGLPYIFGDNRCYLELFAHSVSVSNSNISTADWSIGFTATSPVTGCKISLHRIRSRLLRGKKVIAELPPSSDLFGHFVATYETERPITTLGFNKVVTPEVIGDVIWDIRVEVVAGINKNVRYATGGLKNKKDYVNDLLIVTCGDIPVKFTVDSTGNVTGSLLGITRRCRVSHAVDT